VRHLRTPVVKLSGYFPDGLSTTFVNKGKKVRESSVSASEDEGKVKEADPEAERESS
jgi:hypothetical protein